MSRSASAAPRSPATVEKRANIGVCLPIALKIFALVKRVMSCVTVKVPWAPQPLACMRRSGITSRSKCASFSISQPDVLQQCRTARTGCHDVGVVGHRCAGGVGEALRCGHEKLSGLYGCWVRRMCLAGPGRGADHAAEILGPERGVLVGEHVCLDVAEGRLGLAVDAVVKSLDERFLEPAGARGRGGDC